MHLILAERECLTEVFSPEFPEFSLFSASEFGMISVACREVRNAIIICWGREFVPFVVISAYNRKRKNKGDSYQTILLIIYISHLQYISGVFSVATVTNHHELSAQCLTMLEAGAQRGSLGLKLGCQHTCVFFGGPEGKSCSLAFSTFQGLHSLLGSQPLLPPSKLAAQALRVRRSDSCFCCRVSFSGSAPPASFLEGHWVITLGPPVYSRMTPQLTVLT